MAVVYSSAAKAARGNRSTPLVSSVAAPGRRELLASAPVHPEGKTEASCAACRQRPATVAYKLKIRWASLAGSWRLPLCQPCAGAVMPLGPVAELLWFQSMGVDALSTASSRSGAGISPPRTLGSQAIRKAARRGCRG
jgi:hypothetical protein